MSRNECAIAEIGANPSKCRSRDALCRHRIVAAGSLQITEYANLRPDRFILNREDMPCMPGIGRR